MMLEVEWSRLNSDIDKLSCVMNFKTKKIVSSSWVPDTLHLSRAHLLLWLALSICFTDTHSQYKCIGNTPCECDCIKNDFCMLHVMEWRHCRLPLPVSQLHKSWSNCLPWNDHGVLTVEVLCIPSSIILYLSHPVNLCFLFTG